ncbi:MAG: aminotransferase class V-fold PLP-dependent enzyme [Clostridium sp.]|nr:aminotransferase class V-fold PLP-dependent enzyme [Clostridium sp.]
MIYLDSAATTLQKPPCVARASAWAIGHLASPGRGGHPPAMKAADTAYTCRKLAAKLFHVSEPERVVFTFNATHGLNIAIHSLVKPGMTVLISGYEHNAVTRPLHAIPNVTIKVASAPLFQPEEMVKEFRRLLTKEVGAVVCTHVSNVFGYTLPIEDIAALCREKGVPLVVDASQSAGCVPLDFEALGAAFVAMPGHKGLYGPQGTGMLLCGGEGVPLLQGGTGSESLNQTMPDFLPDRLEAGTHNIAGLAGLQEGLRYVYRRGVESIGAQEQELSARLQIGLNQLAGTEVFGSARRELQTGVLSFRVPGQDCELLCEKLGDRGFALRAGLHCAPLAHQTAGTLETGTIRASVSAFNTRQEIEQFLRVLPPLIKA